MTVENIDKENGSFAHFPYKWLVRGMARACYSGPVDCLLILNGFEI